ncbi:hypothetical protein [Asanoa siamensis]|uniref:Lipoprotein n=1 Tax=Asanoa siamensis TaxID=926357 RepID=A0ABQ4CL64_9ACTN|nr:hypothetical protein [Asanoa siamensis]GIF72024.1 hypothetical protein Asi02nite_15420 [Asanoa siamensis]
MRWLRIAPVFVLLVAGCTGGPRDVDPGPGLAAQRRTAGDVLARWDRAATGGEMVVVGGLGGLRQVGDWETSVGDNNKAALQAGLFEAAGGLPAAPDRAVIRPVQGPERPVRTLSAAAALDRAKRAATRAAPAACGTCEPLRVTGADPTETDLLTVGGPVTAPAWEFRLEGTEVRLVASAVADGEATELAAFGRPADQPAANWVESARPLEGPALDVSFSAAPGGADEPCGADYTGAAVESTRAVVVLVGMTRTHEAGVCPTIAAVRRITVPLREPLGDRVVLQLYTGLPIQG